MSNGVFKKYHDRLKREGWIKSLIAGLGVGMFALLISAFIYWYVGSKEVWMCAIYSVSAMIIATPLMYYLMYKPTTKKMAKRIDELGLEERILTMAELEGDTSYIAMRQREDAIKSLERVNSKMIKIALSVPVIVAVSVTAVFASGMTVVSALSEQSGKEWIDEMTTEPLPTYEITYEANPEEGGIIDGDPFQMVVEGEDCSPVYAEAMDGWVFVKWSDGSTDPYRCDVKVKASMTYVAEFQELGEEGEPGDGDGEPGDGQEGDDDSGKPGDGEGEPGKPGQEQPGNDGDGEGEGEGGQYSPNNQVFNGNTYYGGSTFDNASQQMSESVGSNGQLPPGHKGGIGDYFDSIAK